MSEKISVDEIVGVILYNTFGVNGIHNSDEYDSMSWNWDKMTQAERDKIEKDLSIYLIDKLGIDNVRC